MKFSTFAFLLLAACGGGFAVAPVSTPAVAVGSAQAPSVPGAPVTVRIVNLSAHTVVSPQYRVASGPWLGSPIAVGPGSAVDWDTVASGLYEVRLTVNAVVISGFGVLAVGGSRYIVVTSYDA